MSSSGPQYLRIYILMLCARSCMCRSTSEGLDVFARRRLARATLLAPADAIARRICPDKIKMVQDAPRPRRACTWLVWCFDQCLKLEQLQARRDLKAVAAECNFKFRCHKKSMGFLSWLEGRNDSMLLLADWREAKPIVEALSKRSYKCDIRICVVAQSEKILRRATDWANQQDESVEIFVTSSFWRESAEELVRRHPKTVFHARAAEEMPAPSVSATGMARPAPAEDDGTSFCWSLQSLMAAVKDPKKAAFLEQVIRNTMWQEYED